MSLIEFKLSNDTKWERCKNATRDDIYPTLSDKEKKFVIF